MLITDEKPVELLNHLIEVNSDRLEAYHQAIHATNVPVLQTLFSRMAETSALCREELCGEVFKLGGRPEVETLASHDLFVSWMDLMKALRENNHEEVLVSCAKEENFVLGSYEKAMTEEDEHITTQHLLLFNRQHELLQADSEKVKNLLHVLHG
jgi:uncharacterized protein (TIGR02284 family)